MKIKRLSLCAVGALAALALAGHAFSQDARPDRGFSEVAGDATISPERLRAATDPFFDAAASPSIGETRALLILRDGKIVAERYAPGFGPDTRFLSWSIAKTVTGLLVGIMVGDGRLALDDPAPVAAWRQPGDPRAAITLRMLMQMRSGAGACRAGRSARESGCDAHAGRPRGGGSGRLCTGQAARRQSAGRPLPVQQRNLDDPFGASSPTG